MSKFSKIIFGSYEFNYITSRTYHQVIDDIPGVINTIDTAISYNNAPALNALLRQKNLRIISKIAPQMERVADELIEDHFLELGVDYIDLMLIHNNRAEWVTTYKKLLKYVDDGRIGELGVSNFSIDDLNKFFLEFGYYPKYNEFEINPLYTPMELINFCKINNIKIIAYCILGGKYNATFMIKNYTLCHLVNYAASLADHIILRTDNFNHAIPFISVLKRFYSCKYNKSEIDSKNKVINPMQYKLPEYMSVSDNMVIYHGNPWSLNCITMDEAVMEINTYDDPLIDMSDFLINTRGFEFITDLRVYLRTYLRGLGQEIESVSADTCRTKEGIYQIYIIDTNGKLSKIITPGAKILVKFKRLSKVEEL